MSDPVKNRGTLLITGAAGAIGSACCETLSASGYTVIGMDRRNEPGPGITYFINSDLRDLACSAEARSNMAARIADYAPGGTLVGLVNNAATQINGGIEELEVEDVRHSFDVNFISAFALCKICLPLFAVKGASIVNVGSIHSILTKPNFLAYSTSKHALDGLTRALAVELGKKNIRVNLIMPAATDTHMLRAGFACNGIDMNRLDQCHPLGRIARPVEIARGIRFLLSEDSSFVSGSTLRIDGAIGVRLHDPE